MIEDLQNKVKLTRVNPALTALLHDEKYGYYDEENKRAGIVILDKIDKDWSYVVLHVHSDLSTECIDMKASIPSVEQADAQLRVAMKKKD
jgi:hypothetical protein